MWTKNGLRGRIKVHLLQQRLDSDSASIAWYLCNETVDVFLKPSGIAQFGFGEEWLDNVPREFQRGRSEENMPGPRKLFL
jgi:hypothetical protein